MSKIRVGLQQRVIPSYRVPFIQKLADLPQIELHVFAGLPRQEESIASVRNIPDVSFKLGRNIHLFRKSAYVCLQPGLIPWMESINPDVMILEANPRYPSSRNAIRWLRNQHKGIIGWGLGVPHNSGPLSNFRTKARTDFLNRFDAILAYSNLGKNQYIQAGLSPDQVFVAPNATSPKPVGPAPDRQPFFTNGKPTIIFVGRLQPRKKIDTLINVCAKLPEEVQPELWIVGDGQIKDDLKSLAQSIYPTTKFMGALYGEQLKEMYLRADLFVLPGTGGLAIQEAMSYALPVIIAEGDGSQSNLVNESNGWLIPPDNEIALYNAILHALQNPSELRKMGLAAYLVVSEEVNVEVMVNVFKNVIEKVYYKNFTS